MPVILSFAVAVERVRRAETGMIAVFRVVDDMDEVVAVVDLRDQ
jgi:hypothetical protein